MKTISIVTVTFNAASTLPTTLRSITSQTVFSEQVEFIVIDGGSSDGTLSLLEPYRSQIDQLVSEPDRGIFDAMNKGAQLATAPWIIFMNAGDAFFEDKTLESLRLPSRQPDHVLYGDCMRIYSDGRRELRLAHPFFQSPDRIAGVGICHQSTYVPTHMLRRHPFLWQCYPHCADFKLLHDLWREGIRMEYVPNPLSLYAYGDGFSSNPEHELKVFKENASIVGKKCSWTYLRQRLRMLFN